MGFFIPPGSITPPNLQPYMNSLMQVADRLSTYFGERPSVTDTGYLSEIKFVHTAATNVYGADGNIDWHDTVDILKLAESVHQDDAAFHSTVVNLFSLFSEGGQLTNMTSNDYLNPQYLNSPQANGEPDNSEQQHHTIGTGFSSNALLNNFASAVYWEWQGSLGPASFNSNDVTAFGVGQQSRNHFILEGPDGFIAYLEESVVQAPTEEERAAREKLLAEIQAAYESGNYDPEHPETIFENIALPETLNHPKPTPVPKDERDDRPAPTVPLNSSGSPDDRDEHPQPPPTVPPVVPNSSGSPDDRDERPPKPPTAPPVVPNSSGSPDDRDDRNNTTATTSGGGTSRRSVVKRAEMV